MKGGVGHPVRLRFTKRGKVRFISHRDVARSFDRAIRIGRLPVAFTEGFSPRPKMSFGLALPVGAESDAEYLDMAFAEIVDLAVVAAALSAALPEGMEVTGATTLVERAPALQESVTSAEYAVGVVDAAWNPVALPELEDAVARFLARDTVPVVRVRKGKEREADLRPGVLGLGVRDAQVTMALATGTSGSRPGEVTDELGPGWQAGRVHRTKQWIERDGSRREPLEADTRPHADAVCAI